MQTEELTPDIIEASVPLYDYQTFSARFGHQITVFTLTLGLIGMLGGAIEVFTSRRKI
jgi:hypothetical protein